MKFRTEIGEIISFPINYSSELLLLGSCFANEIGERLKRAKFNTTVNPFGVLYNPASNADSLRLMISGSKMLENDLYKFGERYLSFYHDTTFSSVVKKEILQNVNNSIELGSSRLKQADILFITFGTAWIYRHKKINRIVSNCHKIPSTEFERELMSVKDIAKLWKNLVDELLQYNPSLKIVFTVSPVRHWKDGAHGNQVSKATLILAIEELLKYNDSIDYFQSYELLLDELRDYRFYADDLIHPSNKAVDYIWNHFKKTFLSDELYKTSEQVEKITAATQHRIIGNYPQELQTFRDSMLKKINDIALKHPEINFAEERSYFTSI